MSSMPEPDPKLAAQIDDALRQLPNASAPSSLIHRVLAAVEAQRSLPWWRRSWWNWPVPVKIAFAVLTAGIAAVLSGGGYVLSEGAVTYSKEWTEHLAANELPVTSFDSLWNAAHLVWSQALLPLFHYALGATVVLYLICIGIGTACFRFVAKQAGAHS